MRISGTSHGGARAGAGRPRIDEDEPTVTVSIKLTATQREKLRRLGGPSWIRKRIDTARDSKT